MAHFILKKILILKITFEKKRAKRANLVAQVARFHGTETHVPLTRALLRANAWYVLDLRSEFAAAVDVLTACRGKAAPGTTELISRKRQLVLPPD